MRRASETAPERPQAAGRILVVEDSETQALRLRQFLEDAGYEVDCAKNANEAFAHMSQRLPALVITDYNLPGVSGDELCRRIRMKAETRGVPVLMLTSDEAMRTETRGLESGADDFVRKSEQDGILLIRVQALLSKARAPAFPVPGQSPLGPTRLLVVDDSDTYREYVEMELDRAGYSVQTAVTGAEALEKLALETFDGVVLDMILPDMSGAEMCERFVAARRTLDRPFVILMLTGGEDLEEMNAVIAAGADDVVGKSREAEIIKARLATLIRRKLMHEENLRLTREFQERERAVLRAEAEKEAAEARAALADQLSRTNEELEAANRELKATQAQLVQSEKMASLGQLVAGIAHEINNPLSFVMSYQSTVLETLETLAPELLRELDGKDRTRLEKACRRLKEMRGGLERIGELVLQLRIFSRKDDGEKKPIKVEECIESVITLLSHKLGDRISLKRNYGNTKILSCYPGPLNQVIMNVLSNAIDAIDGEGEITITTSAKDGDFIISITDSGLGIPTDVQEQMFDPFFTTKPVGKGVGLGLSIAYGIIKRHGGTIEVQSGEGTGTTFTLRIPRQAAAPADA